MVYQKINSMLGYRVLDGGAHHTAHRGAKMEKIRIFMNGRFSIRWVPA